MEILPTLLHAAGDPRDELDGVDLLPSVTGRAPVPKRDLFWEMNRQTAARRGAWNLVLNVELVEGAPAGDAVHLADIAADIGRA